jgi:broad specificity phosphatase PhoE
MRSYTRKHQTTLCLSPSKFVRCLASDGKHKVPTTELDLSRQHSKISLSALFTCRLGWEEACKAGKVLRERVLASGETVHFIVSPYVRTVETFHGLVSAWCDPHEFSHIENRDERLKAWYGRLLELGLTWHEDPRIREQDFGNYQDPTSIKAHKRERWRFGPFFYRFPHGESASDVFDRVSTFLDSLWRSFDLNRSRNYVLVTHGISIRVLLARYFRYSIDQFNVLSNPRNCEMVILGHDGQGRLQLNGRCEMEYEETESGEKKTAGYSFHKRLRVLPRQWVKKVKIRISYDDDDDGEG